MKTKFLPFALALVLGTLPMAASALMTEEQVSAKVQQMLQGGKSSNEIIMALKEDGRSLEDATALAVGAAPSDNQAQLARAGICAANDFTMAQGVGSSVLDLDAVRKGSTLATEVQNILANYNAGGCAADNEEEAPGAPNIGDQGDESGTGGGTDPENLPPITPPDPPVSPA